MRVGLLNTALKSHGYDIQPVQLDILYRFSTLV